MTKRQGASRVSLLLPCVFHCYFISLLNLYWRAFCTLKHAWVSAVGHYAPVIADQFCFSARRIRDFTHKYISTMKCTCQYKEGVIFFVRTFVCRIQIAGSVRQRLLICKARRTYSKTSNYYRASFRQMVVAACTIAQGHAVQDEEFPHGWLSPPYATKPSMSVKGFTLSTVGMPKRSSEIPNRLSVGFTFISLVRTLCSRQFAVSWLCSLYFVTGV